MGWAEKTGGDKSWGHYLVGTSWVVTEGGGVGGVRKKGGVAQGKDNVASVCVFGVDRVVGRGTTTT